MSVAPAQDAAPGDFLTAAQAREILVDAEKAKAEAAVDRRAAEKALAEARYAQGQAEFQNREASQKIASLQQREELMKQYDAREAALAEREKAIDEKQRRADETMSHYNADKHQAAQALARDIEHRSSGGVSKTVIRYGDKQ